MNNERVTTFPFDPTEFPFNIEMSGITNCDSKYEVYREKSYCYILEYVYGGSAYGFSLVYSGNFKNFGLPITQMHDFETLTFELKAE